MEVERTLAPNYSWILGCGFLYSARRIKFGIVYEDLFDPTQGGRDRQLRVWPAKHDAVGDRSIRGVASLVAFPSRARGLEEQLGVV